MREDLAALRREVQALRSQSANIAASARQAWVYPPQAQTATQNLVLGVIGGNAALIGSGLEGIKYASVDPTLTSAPDPNVTTVYAAGLGYGNLYTNGRLTGKVLIRHNYPGAAYPVVQGALLRSCGTVSLPWDDGTGHAGAVTAYVFDWL
jgi:hypothetical protein